MMRNDLSIYRRTLSRIQLRFRRARPGSVLIMVVALLVLMALIGTAYITTAQTDRYSAAQNAFNTEIDLLVQGVINLVDGRLVADLYGGTTQNQANYRPAASTTYTPYTTTGTVQGGLPPQPWLGDRAPITLSMQQNPPSYAAASAANPGVWAFVSAPPTGSAWQFESPYINGNPATYVTRTNLQPTYVPVQSGNTAVLYPALYDPVTSYTYLAADADGDGVADTGLFRLPVGEINGVTYYAGVRIIDNAAAVNASVAWTWPFGGARIFPQTSFFPTSVNLNSLLVSTGELPTLALSYRLNNAANGVSPSNIAVDDLGTTHPDFIYINQWTNEWFQLGRRLDNPGYVQRSDGMTPKYLALPPGEAALIARRFILRDPSVTAYAASPSILEQKIPTSVFGNPPNNPASYYRTSAYTDTLSWYNNNFNYAIPTGAGLTNTMPVRALLTARNSVSNFAPSKFVPKGPYDATIDYNFGEWVKGSDGRTYVCILPNGPKGPIPAEPSAAIDPTSAIGATAWALEPWSNAPTKTSANTATFNQLWLAYWSVMWDSPSATPGAAFGIPFASEARMFRNSMRDPAGKILLSAKQELQLRAALAAVNTIDLRDSDNKWGGGFGDVTSHKITLAADPTPTPANSGSSAFDVMVYGGEANPYITEVYANNNPGTPGGYIAIELYNPFEWPLFLTNWQLATISRTAADSGNLKPIPLTSTTTNPWATTPVAANPMIPAHGYIVLASSATPPAKFVGSDGANQWPKASLAAKTLYVVPDLAKAINNELVLLRPRRAADWSLTASADPTNSYNEAGAAGSGTLDLVPVDSYDFTGPPVPGSGPGDEWWYRRPNDSSAAGGKSWHFVYGGAYNWQAGQHQWAREGGTAVGNGDATGPVTTLTSFGQADNAGVPTPQNPLPLDVPIQINSTDFGGPFKHAQPGGNANIFNTFPYGGFARNADLLQVPFIGAYRVSAWGTNQIVELNAVTEDAAAADAADYVNLIGPGENVGRFVPINAADANPASKVDDYAEPSGITPNSKWRYHWAMQLFDYLTVQAPQDDYFPDVDPGTDAQGNPKYSYWDKTTKKYVALAPAASIASYPPSGVIPVANANPAVANAQPANSPPTATDDTVPVQGLININTANWKVLSSLPLVLQVSNVAAPDLVDAVNTATLAQAIVYFRDVNDGSGKPHGPFKNIYELNLVTVPGNPALGFRNAMGTINPNGGTLGNDGGDLSPYTNVNIFSQRGASVAAAPDTVVNNFEEHNAEVIRISNLITTRSDSFTVYIIVQGFRNVGTASPELVVQRRAAFIADRSAVTPNNSNMSSLNVPVN